MSRIIDKTILLFLSVFGMYLTLHDNMFLICLYLSIFYSGINYYLIVRDKAGYMMNPADAKEWISFILEIVACLIILLYSPAIVVLPIVIYDLTRSRNYIGFTISVMTFINAFSDLNNRDASISMFIILYVLTLSVLAVILSVKSEQRAAIYKELKRIRDDDAEINARLRMQNTKLLSARDTEIHNAQLAERNRIARDIHDNVGHMLSRALLQMGALLSIHKEEPVHSQLEGVRETLDTAMDNIRSSVHDLHDDSIDVRSAIYQMAKPLEERFILHIDIDISDNMPRNIKYACIGITKECISNIIKHSRNSDVSINLGEHPSFYQLIIHDYGKSEDESAEHIQIGTSKYNNKSNGMGLENIQSRVDSVNGSLNITNEDGFRIFVSIPK